MSDRDDSTGHPEDATRIDTAVNGEPTTFAEPVEFVDIRRGETTWRFDADFLRSNWTCIWGDGCRGILDEPAEELGQGCCSLGAHFGPGPGAEEEAMQVSAFAALLTPERWQHHAAGTGPDGIFGDADHTCTRVVDGACIFLNRPGFTGGAGCALHLAAEDAGESPIDWKPSVCWQLPLHVDFRPDDPDDPDGPETATVRRWGREQWGETGATMAWCCTERADGGEAYRGGRPVIDSMADELVAIAGDDVVAELRRLLP